MRKQVRVKPNAKQNRVTEDADGSLTVWLSVPPVDGKANVALIQLLAHTYGVPKSQITIVRGHTGRLKLVDIG
ncbi:DUF167 domain-containing protein [Prochlorothrix hollandica]|uniref:UPF0235 protein PROH_16080 n=1 Tax=Prochlorothrix hollandica PCC 9006 = CALU 1027 TaxID=317619 RepID=A0A0M2PT10_PROHO|nr:DUF167 domain-containing protein [Prochlorothrix hollandica]KKI99254.1 hypothetical protein PROH_16080 [Prochlorothrix hollandica PCC 9006 = CALU 1027]